MTRRLHGRTGQPRWCPTRWLRFGPAYIANRAPRRKRLTCCVRWNTLRIVFGKERRATRWAGGPSAPAPLAGEVQFRARPRRSRQRRPGRQPRAARFSARISAKTRVCSALRCSHAGSRSPGRIVGRRLETAISWSDERRFKNKGRLLFSGLLPVVLVGARDSAAAPTPLVTGASSEMASDPLHLSAPGPRISFGHMRM